MSVTSVCPTLLAGFTVLVHHAVYTAFFHRLAVMDMLGRELSVLAKKQLHTQ